MKLPLSLLCLTLLFTLSLSSFPGWTQTIATSKLNSYLEESLPSLSILLNTDFSFPLISNVWKENAHPNHFWLWVVEDDDEYTIFVNADDAKNLAINAKTGHLNPGSLCF